MQRRYVAVRGASLAGGAFQSWLGDIFGAGQLQEGGRGLPLEIFSEREMLFH